MTTARVEGRHLVGWLGVVLLVGTAAVFATVGVEYLSRSGDRSAQAVFVLEYVLVFLAGGVLVVGATRLTDPPFDGSARWLVAQWTGLAALGGLAVLSLDLFHGWLVVGSITPGLVATRLLLGSAYGGVLGFVVGRRTALSQANARRARRRQSEFSFLNHLLRHHVLNRLNVVQGYSELLIDDVEDEANRERLRTIVAQSESIADLVRDVRTVSAALSGDSLPEPVDLVERTEASVRDHRERYPEATFEADLPERLWVRGNGGLKTAIDHLLTNAVEHHDGDEPDVRVSTDRVGDGMVELRVADDGPGIPEGRLEGIFDAGTKGDEGFGLYLVHTVVSDCGGDVSFSDRDGGGTVVRVRLPRADSG